MRSNPIQFAVVREDSRIEAELVRRLSARQVLLIGSGGCTALSLQCEFPELGITLLDPNPAQLALICRKAEALSRSKPEELKALFNIGNSDARGLNACGNFESLFTGLRRFIEEFILSAEDIQSIFRDDASLHQTAPEIFRHKYWPVAFELFFSDAILVAMFGPDAIQHAEPGSYPRYFQKVFERGLLSPGASRNPFLHHLFFGHYLDQPECLPAYLSTSLRAPAPEFRFDYRQGLVDSVPDFSKFDLIHLSNIFDWMSPAAIEGVAARLGREMKPGSAVVYRQLNNSKDYAPLFGSRLRFDPSLGEELLATDRSLFYCKIAVGISQT